MLDQQARISLLAAVITSYLSWFRDLEISLQGDTEAHLLLSSAVAEPRDMLRRHLDEFRREVVAHLDSSNAWEHRLLVARIAQRYGVSPRNVAVTNGVLGGIYLICRALLDTGRHAVIESPVYEPLAASADFIGSSITHLPRRPPDYHIDPDDLRKALRPQTALLIISNPHNPSGSLLDGDCLMQLAIEAKRVSPEVKIVVDEVYHDFTFGCQKPAATLDDCFISLNSLTKVYGLGCIHSGWMIGEAATIDRVKRLQLLVEGSGSRLLDGFALFAIERLDEYLARAVEQVARNRPLVSRYLEPLVDAGLLSGKVPQHSCIFFPRVSGVDNTMPLVQKLAEEYQVYVVPGSYFKEPAHIRIGFGGATEKLDKSLKRLAQGLSALAPGG